MCQSPRGDVNGSGAAVRHPMKHSDVGGGRRERDLHFLLERAFRLDGARDVHAIRLEFDGNTVEIEDRRVDTPITMIASLVEQEWKCKVQGAKSKYNFPKFFYANPDPAAKS